MKIHLMLMRKIRLLTRSLICFWLSMFISKVDLAAAITTGDDDNVVVIPI